MIRRLGCGILVMGVFIACGGSDDSSAPAAASAPLACRQEEGSDTDDDCVAHTSMRRKLDCDDETQTAAAIAAGCVRTDPTDKDVCCPTTVQGTPDAKNSSSSSSSSGSSSECSTSYAGSWKLSGACATATCTVSQAGCALAISCTGDISLSGNIASGAAAVSGTQAGNPISCKIDFAGTEAFSLDCSVCKGAGVRQ